MKIFACFCILQAVLTGLFAVEVEEIQSVERDLEALQIPSPKGDERIPKIKFSGESIEGLVAVYAEHEIPVYISPEVKERRLTIALRNLSLNLVLDFTTRSCGAEWVYWNGAVAIYDSESKPSGQFGERAHEKNRLERKQSVLERLYFFTRSDKSVKKTSEVVIPEFSFRGGELKDLLTQLQKDYNALVSKEDGVRINLFGSQMNADDFAFEGRTLHEILDAVAKRHDLFWNYKYGRESIEVLPMSMKELHLEQLKQAPELSR